MRGSLKCSLELKHCENYKVGVICGTAFWKYEPKYVTCRKNGKVKI